MKTTAQKQLYTLLGLPLFTVVTSTVPPSKKSFNGNFSPYCIQKELDKEAAVEGVSEGMGLNYFGWRYYDPKVAMWISLDPKEQFWSGYSYTGNGFNPVNGIDADGKYYIKRYWFAPAEEYRYSIVWETPGSFASAKLSSKAVETFFNKVVGGWVLSLGGKVYEEIVKPVTVDGLNNWHTELGYSVELNRLERIEFDMKLKRYFEKSDLEFAGTPAYLFSGYTSKQLQQVLNEFRFITKNKSGMFPICNSKHGQYIDYIRIKGYDPSPDFLGVDEEADESN